jgi:hypothetical protein
MSRAESSLRPAAVVLDEHGLEVIRRPQLPIDQTTMPIVTIQIAGQGTTPS